jgi:hypothetical protein
MSAVPKRRNDLREIFNPMRRMVHARPLMHAANQRPAVGRGLSTDHALNRRRGLPEETHADRTIFGGKRAGAIVPLVVVIGTNLVGRRPRQRVRMGA